MGKPFQISIRRMMTAVALLGVSASLTAAYLPARYRFPIGAMLYYSASGFAGAGVGTIFKRPLLWILLALIAASIAAVRFQAVLINPQFPLD